MHDTDKHLEEITVVDALDDLQAGLQALRSVLIFANGSEEVLEQVVRYLQSLMNMTYENSNFVLVKLNETGMSSILNSDTGNNGIEQILLKAIPALPKNSTILVFANRKVEDNSFDQLTWKELNNQINLIVIWNQGHPTLNNDLVSPFKTNQPKIYDEFYITNLETVILMNLVILKSNVTKYNLQFPVDDVARSIHIIVTMPLMSLQLTSPQGFVLNLLNDTQIEMFSEGSFVTTQLGERNMHLNMERSFPTRISEIWKLGIDSNGSNLTLLVQTVLNITVSPTQQSVTESFLKYNEPSVQWGSITTRNVSLDDIDFENFKDVDSKLNVDFNDVSNRLSLTEKYQDGKRSSQFSYLDRERVPYLVQPLSIEIGAGSELLVRPNQQAKIYFEVTNNRDNPIFVNFMCQDQKRLIYQMQPRSGWLNPKQTTIVTVFARTSQSILSEYLNVITFSAVGPERAQKSAQMFVTNSVYNDNEEPRLTHRYTSDCTDILLGDCQDGTWSIEVVAEDRDSGLLQLTSNPKNLYFPNNYVAGTKEAVVGLYGGSCCQPKIQLTAIDLSNNKRTYTADAYNAPLSAGSISAIVLGIFILIVLIIIIIVVVKKMRTKKQSVDLPVYRSPHGNTRER
ncbi:hypothetical protein FQR65_LT19161 [Abscondita terminalis]|nr:hypothetical protein FQR65_LT19161 [Abscondita terminalis]